MKTLITASVIGLGTLGLGACAVPVGQQVAPQPVVTVTQAAPESSALRSLRRVWVDLSASDQAEICAVVRKYPDAAFAKFNENASTSSLTRQEFSQFFSEVC